MVGAWWELKESFSQRNKVLPTPCCCGAEGLPAPLLSQIQQGVWAVICSTPDAAAPKPQMCGAAAPKPLSAPALEIANPPAKGPKTRFDDQTPKQ